MRSFAFLLALLLVPSVLYAGHQNPSIKTAAMYQPLVHRPGGSYCSDLKAAARNLGYDVVSDYWDEELDLVTSPTVDQFFADMESMPGLWGIVTHDFELACFEYTEEGENARNNMFNNSPYKSAIFTIDRDTYPQLYSIGIDAGAALAYVSTSNGCIAHLGFCNSEDATVMFKSPGAVLGYGATVALNTAILDFWNVWGKLGDDADPKTVTEAITGTALSVADGDGTAQLCPWKVGSSISENGNVVPANGLEFWVDIRGDFTRNSASSVMTSTHFTVSGAQWCDQGDDVFRLQATLSPVGANSGPGAVLIHCDLVPSLACADIVLNGKSGYDICYNLITGVNPAAFVSGFGVSGGVARWEAIPFNTDRFIVEGGDDPVNGPWEEIVAVTPHPENEQYAVPVSTERYQFFRLTEVETNGRRLFPGYAEADATKFVEPQAELTTLDYLESALESIQNHRDTAGVMDLRTLFYGEGKAAVFFTPNDWMDEVQECVADYWQNVWGVTTFVEGVDDYPVPEPDNRDAWRAFMKERIQYYYNEHDVRYVHFIGGANDWDMWSQDWPEGEWADYKNYYNMVGYPSTGQPELDHIPTFYIPDDADPDVNTAGWTWWIPSDSEYKKLDDGTTLDIALGRWPVNSAEGVLAWAATMQQYNDRGIIDASHNVEIWTGELQFSTSADSLLVMDAAAATAAEVPSGVSLSYMYERQFPDVGVRNLEAARRLNHEEISVLGLLASNSGRRYPGKQFDNSHYPTPFTMALLHETVDTPYIIGASCGTADFQRTAKPTSPGPICEVMGEAPNKGFIAMLGAMCGTWQHANHQISVYAMRTLWAGNDPANPRSLAMSWTVAEEALQEEFSDDYGLQRTLLSYTFLGDPLSPLRRPMRVSGLPETEIPGQVRLDAAYPNPFNPSTIIRFMTPQSGAVKLAIYDLRGRKVHTLIAEALPSGCHDVVWCGDDDSGRRVASGTYFYRLEANGRILSRKLIMAK